MWRDGGERKTSLQTEDYPTGFVIRTPESVWTDEIQRESALLTSQFSCSSIILCSLFHFFIFSQLRNTRLRLFYTVFYLTSSYFTTIKIYFMCQTDSSL